MAEVYDRQKVQEEMQKSDDFASVFGQLVSGKSRIVNLFAALHEKESL